MKHTCRIIAPALLLLALQSGASAHDGPPFPVAVDQPLAGQNISIWADPDVGIGTFYVYVEPASAAEALLPVTIHAVPDDPRWSEAETELVPADPEAPYQLIGEVPFEARGMWKVEFAPGSGEPFELEIEVTPPGSLGPIDILWFAFPFLAIGFLWVKGMMRHRAHDRALQQTATS